MHTNCVSKFSVNGLQHSSLENGFDDSHHEKCNKQFRRSTVSSPCYYTVLHQISPCEYYTCIVRPQWFERRLLITLVRNTELRCDWWTNGLQLHLCEAENCVVTDGPTAYNYTCEKTIALSLMDKRLTITLVWNRELRCHWSTNGLQLHLCVLSGLSDSFQLHLCVLSGLSDGFQSLHGAMQHVLTHERRLVVWQDEKDAI